jgi:hypothetical protein
MGQPAECPDARRDAGGRPAPYRADSAAFVNFSYGWLDGLSLAQEQGMLLQVIVEMEWWRALSHRGKMAG